MYNTDELGLIECQSQNLVMMRKIVIVITVIVSSVYICIYKLKFIASGQFVQYCAYSCIYKGFKNGVFLSA